MVYMEERQRNVNRRKCILQFTQRRQTHDRTSGYYNNYYRTSLVVPFERRRGGRIFLDDWMVDNNILYRFVFRFCRLANIIRTAIFRYSFASFAYDELIDT